MVFFYSLGISFNTKHEAISCREQLIQKQFILSNNINLQTTTYVSKTIYSNYSDGAKEQYVIQLFIEGLGIPKTNIKLFEHQNFNELNQLIYNYIQSELNHFNYAFFEFEGADHLCLEDVVVTIKKEGIGEVQNGDPNASYCSGIDANKFKSKRYLDGIIISESTLPKHHPNFNLFKEFKLGYYWLPLH